MSRQGHATVAPQSRGDVHNAQSWQAPVDRVRDSTTGGSASTEHGNNGNNQQAHRSALTGTGQGLPPSASTRTGPRHQYPNGNIEQAHRSALTGTGQGLPPSASTQTAPRHRYSDGNNQQAHRSAPTGTGQGFPPSASTRTASRHQYPPCPFHGPILRTPYAHRSQGQGLDPMSRFLAEGPSEQHALFIRADTGTLSTARGCTCCATLEGGYR